MRANEARFDEQASRPTPDFNRPWLSQPAVAVVIPAQILCLACLGDPGLPFTAHGALLPSHAGSTPIAALAGRLNDTAENLFA
jgi:hypothetical protein